MGESPPTAPVAECLIPECLFNRQSRCYALAITIAAGERTECRTFHSANEHAPKRERTAFVGACTAYSCRHNRDYRCEAQRVTVGYFDNEIGCLTFTG